MWATLFRGFTGWVAKNWAGVAAGYAIGDVAQNISKPSSEESEQKPRSMVVRKMQETFGGSLPIWFYGLITAFIMFYIYRIIDKKVK